MGDQVTVPLDLTDEEILSMALMAHERDITLNAFMVECIEAFIKEETDGG